MEVWETPRTPPQDRASALSRSEEQCGVKLPDHCVSIGWAGPLLQAGRQNPEQQLPPRHLLASSLLQGLTEKSSAHPLHPSTDSKMSCTHPRQSLLTLERARHPASHSPTLDQSESGVPWRKTENSIFQSGCCEFGLL